MYVKYILLPNNNEIKESGLMGYIDISKTNKYQITLGDFLSISESSTSSLTFVHIDEKVPNHDEICKTVLNIIREIKRIS